MSENNKNIPTKLGDDTTLLPEPTNVEYLDANNVDVFGAGDTFISPQFLSQSEADAALKKLAKEIPFQQWYHMPSKKSAALRPLSRIKCALALPREDGAMPHYRFPVNDQQRYPVLTIDEKTPTLLAILKKVREKTQVPYNHVVVLYYKDGNDAIGFHKDKTLDLCETSPIISVSLGAERPYVLNKDNIFHPTATQQVTLPHGSLLALGPKTNADWYHSVIMLKDDKSVQPRISITFRHVQTYRAAKTGELTGKGDQFQDLNWPQKLRGDHRTDNYLDAPTDCSRLLQFWFGAGDDMQYRGGLWWRGMMADAKGANVPERRESTDKYIREQWGDTLLQKPKKGDRDWLAAWTKTPLGSVAAIILYDQLPRHAFRGTKRAFQFDSLACSIAINLLDEHPSLFTSALISRDDKNNTRFPWTYQIFVYMALIHSEEIDLCERGACGLANLYEILKNDAQGALLCSRLLPLMRSAKQHLVALSEFGRYPHRNAALMRESTSEEMEFLAKIPRNSWMKSQMTVVASTASSNKKQDADVNCAQQNNEKKHQKHSRDGFRVLVLHSNRQTPSVFQRKTRDAFSRAVGPGSTLVYAAAPHKYVARGEALDNTKHLLASQSPTTRCWWNATDDAATMVYVGLEETIEYIDDVFQQEGPFDGIIGFSQGATLASLIASLVSNKSPRVTNVAKSLRFCVMISGFCVRDTRSEYCNLTTEPIEIPSFHVWGVNDVLVLPERSKALQDSFATRVNDIHRVTATHHLDHFAKAIAVWPVDQIRDWIRTNFNPRISSETTCLPSLRKQLVALREKRIFGKTDPKTINERILSVFERLAPSLPARGCTVVLNQVDIVLLGARREMANAKQRELSVVAEDLISLAKQFPSFDSWTEKVETILDVFPNAVRAFYIADKHVDVFRNGLVNAVAHSIDLSLKHKECDFIAQQLPGTSNHNYAKNGLVEAIVVRFPQFCVLKRNAEQGVDVAESYRLLLSELKNLHVSVGTPDKKEAQRQVQRVPKTAEQWKEMFSRPLSDFIVNPRAEPVDVATSAEMQHLHKYLRSHSWPYAENVSDNSNSAGDSDAVFPRGTLTSDGRLDLCKQVIGRTGVSDLELSLRIDGKSPLPRVKHLLLGNNIAGLPLAQSVAQMIKEKSTSITTWYIAGNELDADSIGLVANAMATDDYVVQLWLKRNPLKPQGALALCNMLRSNTFLKVLDLTNTGLLDKGVTTLCAAIVDNPNCALTVLYLDSNGLSSQSMPDICEMLKQSQITDICLGCNRFGDTGATMIAEVLHCIEFLEMASCGIGPQGAEALAKSLSTNKTLKKLDLGHLRSTKVLGEIPNVMQNLGATAFANALSTNCTLLSLNLLHNGIYQQGVSNLAKALMKNRTLLYLNIEQLGIPHNELTREAIRVSLKRNLEALTDTERRHANSIMNREHLSQIKSVYRTEQ